MELDYAIEPSWRQTLRPLLQNWRLMAFIGFFGLLFGCFGYTIFNEVVTKGIHQHGNYVEVDLKSMGNFPFDGQNGVLTDVPSDFRKLDGKRVQLRGMMWAPNSAGPQTLEFQFVYNRTKCCFSGPPRVQERVFVFTHDTSGVKYYDNQVEITGVLHVRLKRNDMGGVDSVYDMDLESLNPV